MNLESTRKDLEGTLTDLIGEMTVNPAAPTDAAERQAVYFDRSETEDTKWKSLIAERLKLAKTFEIHCWNEESEWIQLALQYGELKQTNWMHGKVIVGTVTTAFAEMLLGLPKPTDTEIYNKMTPFFNVFLDNNFDSSHYGTEVYL